MKNEKRVVAKERLEMVAGILNQTANENQSMHDFVWMVEVRIEASSLPKSYHKPLLDKGFLVRMFERFKVLGFCVQSPELRVIERVLTT